MTQEIQPVQQHKRIRLDHVLNEGPTLLELATQAVAKRLQENPNLELDTVVFALKKSWDDFVITLLETSFFPLALKLDKELQPSFSWPEVGTNNVPDHELKTMRQNAANAVLLSFRALSGGEKSGTPACGIYAVASLNHDWTLTKLAVAVSETVDILKTYATENKNHLIPSLKMWFDNAENTTVLSSFKKLSLDSVQLQVLHPALLKMSCLESLDLSRNRLNHLPDWLQATRLTHLKSLSLFKNMFWEIPQPLFRFTQLRSLNLSSNRITEIPSTLNCLKELEFLDLSKNQISVIPEEFFCLNKLLLLSFQQNMIAQVPPTISRLSALQRFILVGNPVQTIPHTMKQLTQLEILLLPKQLENSIQEGFFAETVKIEYV